MLDKGAAVGLVACSNAIATERKEQIKELEYILGDIGLEAKSGEYLFGDSVSSYSAKERADILMEMFRNPQIEAIFDISGGDIANGILPYLDYAAIEDHKKPFFGYSDLTTVLNAIYHKSGIKTCLYQVRNLIYEHGERQRADFEMTLIGNEDHLYDIDYEFVRGDYMKGTLIGGNIRCFLKLAGTDYMPGMKHKILLLESHGATEAQVRSYFSQLEQIGAFDEVNGVLLGRFIKLENESDKDVSEILMEVCRNSKLPIVRTDDIGHGADSKAVFIGMDMEFER